MKITCTTDHLKNAVATTERFTGKQVTLPILSTILINTDGKLISLSATNLEFGIKVTIPGKSIKSGSVAVPAKPLLNFLQLLGDEILTLEEKSNILSLSTPESEVSINCLNPSDFPPLPAIKSEWTTPLPLPAFRDALTPVLRAVSPSDFKPEISGVLASFSGSSITLVGTDSFRLAEKVIPGNGDATPAVSCIIPARTVQELLRILPPGGPATISIGENQVLVEWNGARLISRLVDGTFPPYQGIIPSAFEANIVAKREALVAKIRLATIFTSRLNDLSLTYQPTTIELTTVHPELGRSSSRLPANVRGKNGMIVFNIRYLLDGIESFTGEQVHLAISSPSGPALLQDPDDPTLRYLLMPIRPV